MHKFVGVLDNPQALVCYRKATLCVYGRDDLNRNRGSFVLAFATCKVSKPIPRLLTMLQAFSPL